MGGWMDGWMNGWMGGVYGWMDVTMDRWCLMTYQKLVSHAGTDE